MSWRASILTICLQLVVTGQGFPTTTELSKDAFENCLYANGSFYTGLRPVHSSTPVTPRKPCELFWDCRVKPVGSGGERVEALQFDCSDADSSKPYYDARQCRCVATQDHCAWNDDFANQYKCVRRFDENEPAESCRGYGSGGANEYFLELFPNLDELRKYWSCRPRISQPPEPVLMPCNDDLIFDSRSCYCNYYDPTNVEVIRKFNNHPMNRFRCSKRMDRQPIITPIKQQDNIAKG
ncbi:unnamed protein product [Allacma fusca]|uniref:Uncharacterized protein n=1 Tax=Allacma fusca TaxID=39272 RepID=A0A8J2PN43_9HEXA|nr:unnamed protein product [Allacma fusca]